VIAFARAEFAEGEEAQDRLKSRRYGWQIETQPRASDNGAPPVLLLGPGPRIVDRHTGYYWRTSSSPSDVFGDGDGALGWSELSSRALFDQWRTTTADYPDGNIRDAQTRSSR
jgi:hypothetical protein